MRFTDRAIKALKSQAERYEVWADGKGGLGMRVSPQGRKSWIYLYRFDRKPRRMTLGVYPRMGIAKANTAHAQAVEKVEHGIDPGAEKISERKAVQDAETVSNLIDEYLKRHAPKKRTGDQDKRTLEVEIRPVWGERKAKDITRRDIVLLLDDIVDRGAGVMANRTLALVRKLFAFSVERGILNGSPAVEIKKSFEEVSRDRTLSENEVKGLWNGLDEAEMDWRSRLALKLCLVTIQRRQEVSGARKDEFDLDGGVWEIPGERTKNGRTHCVPLSNSALDLVRTALAMQEEKRQERERRTGKEQPVSEYLFPGPRASAEADIPISPPSLTRAMKRNLIYFDLDKTKPAPTPHDLRRTGSTFMTGNGVSRFVVGRVLNHADPTEEGSRSTKVYDRYEYWPEKVNAVQVWDAKLNEILTGEKTSPTLVPMKQSA